MCCCTSNGRTVWFLSEFRRELPPVFLAFIGTSAVVRLPKKERVDDAPQYGPPFSFMPFSPRHRRNGFVRPATKQGIDELVDGDGDLFTPSAHRVSSTVRSVSARQAKAPVQAGRQLPVPPCCLPTPMLSCSHPVNRRPETW